MKKFLLIIGSLSSALHAGAIIRSVTNNSINTDIIVLDVEQPKSMVGAERYVSSQGYGWAIKPKAHPEDKPLRVLTNWGAGAYKLILVREKLDGETCKKYCLLVDKQAIKLKKRENCLAIANERCGTKDDDFPDETQSVAVKESSFVDLYLGEDGRTLRFTAEPQAIAKVKTWVRPEVATAEPEEIPFGRKEVSSPEL